MLIDDLRELDIHLGPDKIRDAVVFRIGERIEEFGAAHLGETIKEPLPSLLPYRNMVTHYNGSLEWYLSNDYSDEGLTLACSFFRPGSISDLHYGATPRLVIFITIDKTTRSFTGANIYYPHQKQYEYDNNRRRSNSTLLSTYSDSEVSNQMTHAYAYLQAFLNILSCKNIKTELENPDEKIQQKRAAKGKLPLVSFYTLKIQNIAHDEKSTSSGLWSNRVHFCRGHMKIYTADAPLFGRHVGRFWFPPHVRGDKKKGVIIKDYEVSVPKTNIEDI